MTQRQGSQAQVKFDIHLYQIEADSYLVDFKKHDETPAFPGTSPAFVDPLVAIPASGSMSDNSGSSIVPTGLADANAISSFVFYEACIKIITELAISG
jgi:hypothetical protein